MISLLEQEYVHNAMPIILTILIHACVNTSKLQDKGSREYMLMMLLINSKVKISTMYKTIWMKAF